MRDGPRPTSTGGLIWHVTASSKKCCPLHNLITLHESIACGRVCQTATMTAPCPRRRPVGSGTMSQGRVAPFTITASPNLSLLAIVSVQSSGTGQGRHPQWRLLHARFFAVSYPLDSSRVYRRRSLEALPELLGTIDTVLYCTVGRHGSEQPLCRPRRFSTLYERLFTATYVPSSKHIS